MQHCVSGAGGEGSRGGQRPLRLGSCLPEAHHLAGALRETHKQSTGKAVLRALREEESTMGIHTAGSRKLCGKRGIYTSLEEWVRLGYMKM